MRVYFSLFPRCLLAGLWICLMAQAESNVSDTSLIIHPKVPERDRNGVLLWLLEGDTAKRLPEDKLEIENLIVNTYRNSEVEWTLKTPLCLFNQSSREAVSESDVDISSPQTKITGVGFHWLSNTNLFIIRSDVRVIIPGGLSKSDKTENEKTSDFNSASATKIHADHAEMDYRKRSGTKSVGEFEGNVVAVDPQLTVKCKKMILYFGEKNGQILRVDALQDVHLFHEGREAIAEKGVFTRETGTLVLSGIKPRLQDTNGNWIVSNGDGIIYNIHTKSMDVHKPELMIQSSNGEHLLSASDAKPSGNIKP